MRKLITAIYFFPNVGFLRSVASGCRSITSWITTFGIICVIFISPAFASQNKFTTSFEAGNVSVTELLEERDLSGNLDYYKYRDRLDIEISKLTKFNISYRYEEKDYETSDTFDSKLNSCQVGFDHTFENFKISPLKLSFDIGFTKKDYKNSPSSGYERSNASLGLSYKHEDLWAIGWQNGFTNYDYEKSSGDQLKMFTKLSGWRKFLEERLKINSFYKFQMVDQRDTDKDRIENTLNLGSSYKLKIPYFSEISGIYETGRNDTKDSEDEDRDDDLRFKYTKWHINSEHPLTEKLDTSFRYGRQRRGYKTGGNGYVNYYIDNKTGFKIFEDKVKKLGFFLEGQYKEADFSIDSLDYIKNALKIKFSYEIKNNWELSPSFGFRKYDHHVDCTRNEKQYELKFDFLKELLSNNLNVRLAYKYLWKDYKYKSDIEQWSLKAGFDYKF